MWVDLTWIPAQPSAHISWHFWEVMIVKFHSEKQSSVSRIAHDICITETALQWMQDSAICLLRVCKLSRQDVWWTWHVMFFWPLSWTAQWGGTLRQFRNVGVNHLMREQYLITEQVDLSIQKFRDLQIRSPAIIILTFINDEHSKPRQKWLW